MTVPQNASDSPLTVVVERHPGTVVLVVSGEIELLTAPELTHAVSKALAERPRLLVIDLLGVTFFASPGLALLANAAETAESVTRLRVVATANTTLRPLRVTGLDRLLDIYPTREDAMTGTGVTRRDSG